MTGCGLREPLAQLALVALRAHYYLVLGFAFEEQLYRIFHKVSGVGGQDSLDWGEETLTLYPSVCACHCICAPPISGTIDEVQEVVAKARMWRWKPYGEVTLRFAQDANVSGWHAYKGGRVE